MQRPTGGVNDSTIEIHRARCKRTRKPSLNVLCREHKEITKVSQRGKWEIGLQKIHRRTHNQHHRK